MIDVLRFWRDVEIFNIPDAPKNKGVDDTSPSDDDVDEDTDDAKPAFDPVEHPDESVIQRFPTSANHATRHGRQYPSPLPWEQDRFRVPPPPEGQKPEQGRLMTYAHAVYLGVGEKHRFVESILSILKLEFEEHELVQPISGNGWMAAFIVGGSGAPLSKTYTAASFTVGVELLRTARSLDETSDELASRSVRFDQRMEERETKTALAWDDLLDEWTHVHELFAGKPLSTDSMEGPGALIVIESIPIFQRKDGTLYPSPEQAATFLNSFYLDDLTTLTHGDPSTFSPPLAQYLGPETLTEERTDLLADPGALARCVSPDLLPAGRWPAPPHEHLALAQQAAVYQIRHCIGQEAGDRSYGLMAVNGPPGTGKTTLLKDVIADVIVERAKRLSSLKDPEDLFGARTLQVSSRDKTYDLPAINDKIVAGTEIVVASSNNAAVQNISFELPFSCDYSTFSDAAYLPAVAANVAKAFELDGTPWGLLSGAMGSKSNREKLLNAVFGYEPAYKLDDPKTHPDPDEPTSLKPWLDLAKSNRAAASAGWAGSSAGLSKASESGSPTARSVSWRDRWNESKRIFDQRLAAVEVMKNDLLAIREALDELPALPAKRRLLQDQLASQQREHIALQGAESARLATRAFDDAADQAELQAMAVRHSEHVSRCERLREKLHDVRTDEDPGWMARMLNKMLGVKTKGYADWQTLVRDARNSLDAAQQDLQTIENERHGIQQRLAQRAMASDAAKKEYGTHMADKSQRIQALTRNLESLDAREAMLRDRLHVLHSGDHSTRSTSSVPHKREPLLPDPDFLAQPVSVQHISSLWVSRELDHARSELFLAALHLHEAALMVNAATWFRTFLSVRGVLTGQSSVRTQEDLLTIWRSLFFVVPVISTTLASFGRLFRGLEAGSLGWLLIDEAGQATPASVAGALWRTRRAVVVGDPLQIEPVMTVPKALVERLGRSNQLDDATVDHWSPSLHSVQTLSDRTMRLGAKVGDTWTGMPLRTHRRCMSPMFDIANLIAYDNQMVQATGSKGIDPDLFESCWIDVQGPANDKVVAEEMKALEKILVHFLSKWPQVISKSGDSQAASVYIISPFRSVAKASKKLISSGNLESRLKKLKVKIDAGTVHTFQGKEASIVFFVLGSSPGEAGNGSRRWAASKPNLLNVAATRAQQRFYVIGNYMDWSSLPNFDAMHESQKRMKRTRLISDQAGQTRLEPMSEETTLAK
ncbi:DEAD/DEAH box helicase [Paraburkholderia caballeronis]|uniref:AAA domain-containing protein n=1 Tax=Paraburkholderia caballeronis TaxID=416943 RepID=A0A1H7L8H8_9BURK|nr:DEAD/DEAH box helicase [Paraburkholderia caballeronis]PXW28345.1 AAA domain-containing protein [Paraburkholderia caballeronis]PXX03711.1 AAA domain-containing protein [Paraburkholderia caballeronis]RAK04455.1 AAA domain-containing protein [Paraburkholderia caballeronis]SED79424.1 AAA domain-containing protein [Paraburkholderia caballeronis]SEK95302.1 AAA domain-containing protein [Paraburkholderia caballeronis]